MQGSYLSKHIAHLVNDLTDSFFYFVFFWYVYFLRHHNVTSKTQVSFRQTSLIYYNMFLGVMGYLYI